MLAQIKPSNLPPSIVWTALSHSDERIRIAGLILLNILDFYKSFLITASFLIDSSSSVKEKADANEALTSLKNQFLIKPLEPIFKGLFDLTPQPESEIAYSAFLTEMLWASNKWIQEAALTVIINLKLPIPHDIEENLYTIYRQKINNKNLLPRDMHMNILTLLKEIPLFSEFSLSDLSLIESMLKHENYLENEAHF